MFLIIKQNSEANSVTSLKLSLWPFLAFCVEDLQCLRVFWLGRLPKSKNRDISLIGDRLECEVVCVCVCPRDLPGFFSPINFWNRLQEPSWPWLRISAVIHPSTVWMCILIHAEIDHSRRDRRDEICSLISFHASVAQCWHYDCIFLDFFLIDISFRCKLRCIPFFCHWRHHYRPHHDDTEHQCASLASQGLVRHGDGLVHCRLLRLCLLSSDWVCCCKLLYWWTD